ncbi:septum formation initiator family protein [Thermodesulfobacteriota bacterium]
MDLNKRQFFQASLFIMVFIGVILSWLAFGDRGFLHLYRMEKERQEYIDRIKKLEVANKKLMDEIDRLRNDREYIEATAKKELGLVRENEVIFRFGKDDE